MASNCDKIEYIDSNDVVPALDDSQHDEDCMEFFPGFLNCLDREVRKLYLQTLHGIKNKRISDPIRECQKMLIHTELIRDVYPSHHFILIRELACALNDLEEHNSAITFVESIKKESYWMYLVLGRIYEEMGNYEKAIGAHEGALRATLGTNETLKRAVATIKLAVDIWHHDNSPSRSRHYQNQSMTLLMALEQNLNNVLDPTTEEATLFLDAYKTTSYMLRIQEKHDDAMHYGEKVLRITHLSPKAYVMALKIHSVLGASMAFVAPTSFVEDHIRKASGYLELVIKNDHFIQNHPNMVIHILSKIGHCYQTLNSKLNPRTPSSSIYLTKSLNARLQLLEMTKKYLGPDHPELARSASDVALLHFIMGNNHLSDEYIEITEDALENTNYQNDETKKKLYVREISDALRNLGSLFTDRCNFGRAEENYQLCLDLNIDVYGAKHQRTARIHRGMGHMYRRWGKISEAEASFLKCLEIYQNFCPQSQNIMNKVEKDLKRLKQTRPRQRCKNY